MYECGGLGCELPTFAYKPSEVKYIASFPCLTQVQDREFWEVLTVTCSYDFKLFVSVYPAKVSDCADS